MENHKRPTQADRLLQYLRDFGSITALEAIQDLGILNLKGRIFELRERGIWEGYYIRTTWENVKNRYGENTRIARYVLETQMLMEAT